MNAISGPAASVALSSILTNAPVQSVRPVASNARRASLAKDVFEPSSGQAPAVTYGRNGRVGGDADGDGDRS